MSKKSNPSLVATMQHELWCCKMQYGAFQFYKSYLYQHREDRNWKALAFTSYGNFLRHLYSFYEASIKRRRKDLLQNVGKKDSDAINHLLNQEVRKLIRNRRETSESPLVDFEETIEGLDETNVNEEFGNHLCQIRHYFSHVDPRRVNDDAVSLRIFYKRYHNYAHLLFLSIQFSWDSPNGPHNEEIDKFANLIQQIDA